MTNHDFLEQFIVSARRVELHQSDRQAIRRHLQQAMTQSTPRPIQRSRWIRRIVWNPALVTITVVAVVAGLSGSIAIAAENSLPGDRLYGLKTGLTEQVVQVLTFSPQAKTNLDRALLKRRLQEAETLADQGRLSSQTQGELNQAFERLADRISHRIDDLAAAKDHVRAAQISSDLEADLNVHQQVLVALTNRANHDEEITSDDTTITNSVSARAAAATADREDHEALVNAASIPAVESAAHGGMKAAQNKINEVAKFINRKKDKNGASSTTAAEARLATARQTLAQGQTQLADKDYAEAYRLFQQTHRQAQEAKLLVDIQKQLHVDLEESSETQPSNEGRGHNPITLPPAAGEHDPGQEPKE